MTLSTAVSLVARPRHRVDRRNMGMHIVIAAEFAIKAQILQCAVQRVERSSAFVQRRVRLPESADMSKIKAAYTNGTLTLDVPKAEVC